MAFANFNPANLALVVVGDGGSTTGNQQVRIREVTRSGGFVSEQSLAGVRGRNLTVVWGETSEGGLRRSGDVRFLMLAGYDLEPRGAGFNVFSTPRVVARIGFDKSVDLSPTFVPAEGDGIREVWSDDGSSFIATGGDVGLVGGPFDGPVSTIVGGGLSTRNIQRFNGLIYFNGSNAWNGANGMATWDGTTVTPLFQSPASGRDFHVVDENTVYYAHSGGLGKMVRDGNGVWSETYRLAGTGIGHIAVDGTAIFATASNGSALFRTDDLGASFAPWTTLATADPNTRFRGVELAPVPEPATLAALGVGLAAMLGGRRRKK